MATWGGALLECLATEFASWGTWACSGWEILLGLLPDDGPALLPSREGKDLSRVSFLPELGPDRDLVEEERLRMRILGCRDMALSGRWSNEDETCEALLTE
jgi:hypothetical protein